METLHPIWLITTAATLAAVPIILGLATSYLKVSIVLGMTRSALGTQQVPSGLVIMGLSLAITLFMMAPVIEKCMANVPDTIVADLKEGLTKDQFTKIAVAFQPWIDFLEAHAGVRELNLLTRLADSEFSSSENSTELSESASNVSIRILLPAFVLTELKEAFTMAFVLLLPFLAIDLVVANILVGLGMYMVSPVMISLPIKLILFVVSDGWMLLVKGLIQSYGG